MQGARISMISWVLTAALAGCGSSPGYDGDRDGAADADSDGDGDGDTDFNTDGPCSADAEAVLQMAEDMVVCKSTVGQWAQWAAEANCNGPAGWQMCTPEQYLARGGVDSSPDERAWIAGCVRDGGDVHAPEPGVCGEGDGGDGEVQDYVWDCDSNSSAGSSNLFLGIYAIDECHRLGVPDPANEGLWSASWTIGLRPSICCR